MKLSLIYVTGRRDPHLDWTLDALASQWKDEDEVELILVDALGRGISQESTLCGGREQVILARSPQITRVIATLPKPNMWQGAYRLTDRDWWATAVSRNTGIVLATHPQLAFLDDRCRPGAQWAETVQRYAELPRAVAAGSYDKLEGDVGAPYVTQDHRIGVCPEGMENCGGGWLYGCSLTLPLAAALDVNGFEEGCCGMGGEDYIFGLMLEKAGYRIDYSPALHVSQDRTNGNSTLKGAKTVLRGSGGSAPYASCDKGTASASKSYAAITRFGSRKRTEFTPDLCGLRAVLAAGGDFLVPDPTVDHRDWYDGELIRNMKMP